MVVFSLLQDEIQREADALTALADRFIEAGVILTVAVVFVFLTIAVIVGLRLMSYKERNQSKVHIVETEAQAEIRKRELEALMGTIAGLKELRDVIAADRTTRREDETEWRTAQIQSAQAVSDLAAAIGAIGETQSLIHTQYEMALERNTQAIVSQNESTVTLLEMHVQQISTLAQTTSSIVAEWQKTTPFMEAVVPVLEGSITHRQLVAERLQAMEHILEGLKTLIQSVEDNIIRELRKGTRDENETVSDLPAGAAAGGSGNADLGAGRADTRPIPDALVERIVVVGRTAEQSDSGGNRGASGHGDGDQGDRGDPA